MKIQTNVSFEIPLPKSFIKDFVEIKTNNRTFSLPVFEKSDTKKYIRFSTPTEGSVQCFIEEKPVTIAVSEYKGINPLFLHGPIVVSENDTLTHADGTPFFYLADTWWFGATRRLSDKEFTDLLKLRKQQGFTAIQIVVGIPPEVEAFDENAKNAGGYPFDKEWTVNKTYFDVLDKRIDAIVESGLVPVIFGGWGHHIDWMGKEHVAGLWREIISRYASYPVIFCLSGEVDVFLLPDGINPEIAEYAKNKAKKVLEILPRPLSKLLVTSKHGVSNLLYKRHEQKLLHERIKKWAHVGAYIHQTDPFGRIITAHPQRQIPVAELFGNPSWLTLNAIQSGHSRESIFFMKKSISTAKKPIINLEPWYEGITGSFHDYYQRVAFWTCLLSGANGHGYGAHGIWQFAKNDNFMKHWGSSDAKSARSYEGAHQLGASKKFLEERGLYQFRIQSLVTNKTNKNTMPIVSGSCNQTSCIYIPDQRNYKDITLHQSITQKLITLIDPSTMRKIKSMRTSSSTLNMPIDPQLQDILLLVE